MKCMILLACLSTLSLTIDPPLPLEFTATEIATISLGSNWESNYQKLPGEMVIKFDGDTLSLMLNQAIYLKTDVLTYRYSIRRGKQTYTLEISKDGFMQYIIIEAEQTREKLNYGIMIPNMNRATGQFFSYKIFK